MHTRLAVCGLLGVGLLALGPGCSSSSKESGEVAGDAAVAGVIDPGVGGAAGETGAAGMGGTTAVPGGTTATAAGGKSTKPAGSTTTTAGATGGKGSTGKVAGTTTIGGATAGGATTGGATVGGAGGTGAVPETCIGSSLLSALGKSTVLVGASMEDATAAKAPFDGRYLYLSGGYFDGATPCASCASGCTASQTSCANSGPGCAWWGCWQYDQDPPGQYAVSFIASNDKTSPKQIPMLTYYQELQASGLGEGSKQVAGINDATFLTRYFADWRFLLQRIGSHPALLHIEPDFWGYVEQMNADPHAVPAKVAAANPTDCAGYEDSAAGFAKCLIHMVRVYAPKAKVGLHASAWGTNYDVFGNTNASLNLAGEIQKMVAFLTALGAKDGDFIVSDPSDRDAGYYQSQGRNTWWDTANNKLPHFHQAFAWIKAVAEGLGLPVILWQIPVGNMSQTNTTDHWQDNRLEYFFAHMDEVAAAHVAGLFFGAGMGGMTTPETDGGVLVAKTKAYATAGGTKLCP
jgi:hypothetical protein